MGLFNPPTPPTPPPPPPAANPPIFASASTLGPMTRRQAKPMGGTDLTSGEHEADVMRTAALGLGGNKG